MESSRAVFTHVRVYVRVKKTEIAVFPARLSLDTSDHAENCLCTGNRKLHKKSHSVFRKPD